jgi:peptidoglycan-associated lipoprotein
MKTFFRPVAPAAVLVVLTACGGNPESPPPPPPPAPAPVASTPAPRPTTNNDAEAARRAREAELARMRATMAEIVHFDYDRSEIRADSRAILDRKTRVLRNEPTVRIRVEGHADDRGSTEYNLALASRRAEAVKAYITAAGIQASRIDIVSYGEDRPLERSRSETAWSRNRRAEFVVTGGALTAAR